jgi:hypothetical protein
VARCVGSSHRFLDAVPLLLPSRHHSTAPLSAKRYGKRYEAAIFKVGFRWLTPGLTLNRSGDGSSAYTNVNFTSCVSSGLSFEILVATSSTWSAPSENPGEKGRRTSESAPAIRKALDVVVR